MKRLHILQKLIEENNGYLLTSMAMEKGITKPYLAKYVKENGLERVARGIYITDDVWPDELYIMQVRNTAVIFSGETALYLHNLLDREYLEICVTVPTGYNASHLKTENVRVKYAAKSSYELGVSMVSSSSGNMVRVYDKERCICDLIADRNNLILKGGMLVASIVGVDMRATMDIDTTVKALPLNENDAGGYTGPNETGYQA